MVLVSMLRTNPGAAAAVGVAIAALIGLILWLIFRHRPTPEELEKRRRLMVSRTGRTIEGEITDADAERLYYTYSVRGVEYSATQEIGTLLEFLPCEACRVVGEVSVRYLRNNAANSIVVCEEWSGLPVCRHADETHETVEARKNAPAF
jgi:hypothetical protein